MNRIIIILLLLLPVRFFGQAIILTDSIDEATGKPMTVSDNWIIGSAGTRFYFLAQAEGSEKATASLWLGDEEIEKPSVSIRKARVSGSVFIDQPGEYHLIIRHTSGKNDTLDFLITMEIDRNYYTDAEIFLCPQVTSSGEPSEALDIISEHRRKSSLFILIKMDKPVLAEQIIVDLIREKEGVFKDFVKTDYYSNDYLNLHFAFFEYSFNEPGRFKLNIYNQNEVLIGSKIVEVE